MVKPVKFAREIGFLAREEFLVICKRDHILIHMYIFAIYWVPYCTALGSLCWVFPVLD